MASDTGLRVLVAYDGSPPSERALRWAARLLQGEPGRLIVVHVASDPLSDAPSGERLLDEQALEQRRQWLQQEVERVVGPGAEQARLEVLHGLPGDLLAERVRRGDVDLVAVGTGGKTPLERVVLGSVSQAIVEHSPVPVLVVP